MTLVGCVFEKLGNSHPHTFVVRLRTVSGPVDSLYSKKVTDLVDVSSLYRLERVLPSKAYFLDDLNSPTDFFEHFSLNCPFERFTVINTPSREKQQTTMSHDEQSIVVVKQQSVRRETLGIVLTAFFDSKLSYSDIRIDLLNFDPLRDTMSPH